MPEPSETPTVRPLTSLEMAKLTAHLDGLTTLAKDVELHVYPQRMALLLPEHMMPGLGRWMDYDVIHCAVPEPMLGIPAYRVGD